MLSGLVLVDRLRCVELSLAVSVVRGESGRREDDGRASEEGSMTAQGGEARIPMRKLPGHWNRDWKRAYSILTTEAAGEPPPKGWWARLRPSIAGSRPS